MYICRIKLEQTVMKETKLEIPADYEVDKVETQDGHIVVTFKEKERKLPKSWEEFCEMFPDFTGEYFIAPEIEEKIGQVAEVMDRQKRTSSNAELLPDRSTAESVLALCQLIQLRNAYNGDWVPDWKDDSRKYVIEFSEGKIETGYDMVLASTPLFFKSEELRDEFLRYFCPLIEKLKPLYGIKEGGEK